eukprot:s888_g7.t1
MAEAAACDAALPLLQAALSAAGGLIPRDFSGRVLLNINDAAGLIFSVQGGSGTATVERWSGGASRVDTTIRFDSVDSLRKALQDLAARTTKFSCKEGQDGKPFDMSLMAQLGSGDVSSSSSSTALAKEFTRELDAAIAASGDAARGAAGTSVASLRRRSLESVVSLETCTSWVPNEASQCCQECSKTFNTFWRRHHCRFCGRLLCSTCAPVVQDESKDCLAVLGQSRRGVRRCASCTLELEDGAQPARLSRRESLTSLTSDTAVEAAMERLQFLKEEVAALRKAEQRRLELAVQKGFWQIWVVPRLVETGGDGLRRPQRLCTLLLFCWRISIMAAWVAMLFVLHKSSEGSLLQRNVRVFWSAAVVTCALLATRWKLRSLNLSEGEDYRAEWDATNEVLARFLYQQILKLKGFWIKLGQQLSVNVVMAPAFRLEFGKLQDKIPPMPVPGRKLPSWGGLTLVEEFGAEVASTICIDEKEAPLGTASIAQVHRATPERVAADLRNAQILSKLLALVDPEGVPDLRPIVQSLREVTVKELDFRQEAENQMRAMEAAEKHNAKVLIPKVVPALVSRRAMAMDYVDGEPLSKASERLTQEQRNRLIGAMVDHFAVQFALDGHFHADPHPGNLLVEKGTDRLVVLDWGMCITLPPSKVHAYAQLFAAAATSNPWRRLDDGGKGCAGRVMSCARSDPGRHQEGDVFEPMMFLNFIRFALREAQPAEEAKGQVENFMKAGDDLYQRGPKRFKKSPFDVVSGDPRRTAVGSWRCQRVGDMTYFLKALDLLWCVSSQLHTRHPILQSMFLRSLATTTDIPRSPAELLPPSSATSSATALEQRLRRILEAFYRRGDLLGAQLTAVRLGDASVVADVALGVDSWMRKEPITASTYFNLLDISKLIVSFTALDLLRAGRLRLTDAVRLGNAEVTVEEILSHRSGYWMPLPQQLKELSDLQQMETVMKALKATEPKSAGQQCYHSFSFGYLIAMALENAKCPLPEAWEAICQQGTAMAQELQLDSWAAVLTLPASSTVAELEGDVTTQDFEEVAEMIGYAYAVLGEGTDSPTTSPGTEASRKSLFGREHLLDRWAALTARVGSRVTRRVAEKKGSLLGEAERGIPSQSRELRHAHPAVGRSVSAPPGRGSCHRLRGSRSAIARLAWVPGVSFAVFGPGLGGAIPNSLVPLFSGDRRSRDLELYNEGQAPRLPPPPVGVPSAGLMGPPHPRKAAAPVELPRPKTPPVVPEKHMVRDFLGTLRMEVGPKPQFAQGNEICNASAPLTDMNWAPRGWDVSVGDRIQCESRNRVNPTWKSLRYENWDRNWCWVAVKEMCHENLKTPKSWSRYRDLAYRAGLAPSRHFSPFDGLQNPEVCDGAKHGIQKAYFKEEASLALKWFHRNVQVYVLNLPKFYNRWDIITKRLHDLQIDAIRVIGVDMMEPNAYSDAVRNGWIAPDFDMKAAQAKAFQPQNDMGHILGTVGCAAAHFKAQSQILKDSPHLAIVLEDDSWLMDNFVTNFWRIVTQELPCDWDVLQLLGRCAYGKCISEHLARIQPDANEPADLCHQGVNWGFHGVLYRTAHLEKVQALWKKHVFNPKTPHCLAARHAMSEMAWSEVSRVEAQKTSKKGTVSGAPMALCSVVAEPPPCVVSSAWSVPKAAEELWRALHAPLRIRWEVPLGGNFVAAVSAKICQESSWPPSHVQLQLHQEPSDTSSRRCQESLEKHQKRIC